MRGLKPKSSTPQWNRHGRIFYRCVDWNHIRANVLSNSPVASFTDAWIETQLFEWEFNRDIVASFTDAWIETKYGTERNTKRWVASFTDAWIETQELVDFICQELSHLLQMRGLKPNESADNVLKVRRIFYRCVDWNAWYKILPPKLMSHLLQMRGLKHCVYNIELGIANVASFTDAWIETLKKDAFLMKGGCRIFYRCVDWNSWLKHRQNIPLSRIFYRCVDWNGNSVRLIKRVPSRIFYRCVDWNKTVETDEDLTVVASFTDAWIETSMTAWRKWVSWVASFTDAWIETWTLSMLDYGNLWSHLLQMRGLKLGQIHFDCTAQLRRIFYRCVDWNRGIINRIKRSRSRIFYRCVDWNCCWLLCWYLFWRRIFYRCVDWNKNKGLYDPTPTGRIFYRCVDWNW